MFFVNEYAFLSNFYMIDGGIKMSDGNTYPSVEHAFQAYKSTDDKDRMAIKNCPTPGEAKQMGRHVNLRPDWAQIKFDVMLEALYEKFNPGTHPYLCAKLLNTKDEPLVESTRWHDNEWGDCQCEKCKTIPGKNLLGKALMTVRASLRGDTSDTSELKVGDICFYSFGIKNNSISRVEIVDFKISQRTGDKYAVVKFLNVYVDDSGNGYFSYLQETGNTMNVSLKHLTRIA